MKASGAHGGRWAGAPEVPSPIARLLQSGETDEPSSIVMSQRLQAHRSEMHEPYFKSRSLQQGAKARPGDGTEVAQLRKQSAAMSRDFERLLGAHERQEAAVVDLRQKVRALRQDVDSREKGLELARRTIERLSGEKGQLEAAAAGTQAYVRRLEARLLGMRHAAELEQCCAQLKAQLDQQAHDLHGAQARAAAAEEGQQKAQLDVACLKRGLELAAEQLTRSAGAEVPGTLLRAVARGQEEALGLSLQLSDAKQQAAALAAALEQAREHLQAQQTALTQQQGERQELLQRAEGAEAALEKQRAATAELRRVLDALRPKAGALSCERDELLHQLELERTAAAEAQKEVKQLRATLKHKAATEAALRDELRRVLAGDGLTPSPLHKTARPAQQEQQTPDSARRGAAAAFLRAGSRAESIARRTQAAGAAAAGQPSKRAGSVKAVSRQASAWEQQHGITGSKAESRSMGSESLIAAEPSPTRALARLQEQRRQQQGSRLGEHQPRQPADCELLSPPSSSGKAGLPTKQRLGLAAQSPAALSAKLPAAAQPAPPVQDGRLIQLYTSVLDEQIALLESDLAQLADAPSPVAQLQKRAVAAGAAPLRKGHAAQREPAQQPGAIGAWRSNGAFVAEATAGRASAGEGDQGGRGMQQLMRPGGDTPAPAPVDPHLWHSNPLAASPPGKHQRLPVLPPPQAAEAAADGATTVRPVRSPPKAAWQELLASPPAARPSAGARAAASAAEEDEWAWAVAHGNGAHSEDASSPSLRMAGSEPSFVGCPQSLGEADRAASEQQELIVLASQQGQTQQLAVALPAASNGTCGASAGPVASLSRHWSLPSPGPCNSDWLSSNYEADIEQLEVNSTPPPQRQQHAAAAAAAAAVPATSGSSQGAALVPARQRQAPLLPGLPLLSNSPQQQLVGIATAAAVLEPAQQPQHTLFDLAAMGLSDLED